jgi:hypothetical protein
VGTLLSPFQKNGENCRSFYGMSFLSLQMGQGRHKEYRFAHSEQNRYKFSHQIDKKFFEREREGKLLFTKVSPRT